MTWERLVRALGADPVRVGVMIRGIEADARGRSVDAAHEQDGGVKVPTGTLHLIFVVGAALMSLFAAGFMALADELGPGAGLATLVGAWLVVPLAAFTHGFGLLLSTDDARVVAHWPVTARDVGVARLWILTRRTLEVAIAFAVVPSAVLAFTGSPFVLAGVVTFGASMLQGLLIALGMALVVFALRRTVGRRGAQRFGPLAGLLGFVLLNQIQRIEQIAGPRMPEWVTTIAPIVLLVTPLTFTTWPVLLAAPLERALVVVAVGLVTLVGTAVVAVRLIGRPGAAESEGLVAARRRGGVGVLDVLLRPWLPGRDALVARRVLVAHLREDWSLLARLVFVPVQFVALALSPLVDFRPERLVADADGFRVFHVLVAFVAATAFLVTSQVATSGLRRAAWVVAASPAAHGGWSAWQRGMVRAVDLSVVLPAVIALHVAVGSPPAVALDDLLVLVLVHEAALWIAQWIQDRAPFSVPKDFTDGRMLGYGFLLTIGVLPALVAWLVFVHAPFAWARPLTWLGALAVIALVRRRTASRELVFV